MQVRFLRLHVGGAAQMGDRWVWRCPACLTVAAAHFHQPAAVLRTGERMGWWVSKSAAAGSGSRIGQIQGSQKETWCSRSQHAAPAGLYSCTRRC